MKLPRWTVALMLASSVLGVLGAGAWSWATWPERTARVFVDFMAAGRLDEVENITGPHPDRAGHLVPHNLRGWTQSNLERESRSLFDVIVGRQRFRMPGMKLPRLVLLVMVASMAFVIAITAVLPE